MTTINPTTPATGIATTKSLNTGSSVADTSRLSTKDNLKDAASKFEAVFVGMMLKSMRATKFADGLFDNDATKQFQDMQDDKVAQSMASSNAPLGLGKALSDFLTKNQPALRPDAVKVSGTSAVTSDVSGTPS